MQRSEKVGDSFLFDFQSEQIKGFHPNKYTLVLILILQFTLFFLKYMALIGTDLLAPITGSLTTFLIQTSILCFFLLLTAFSYSCHMLQSLWGYTLLLIDCTALLFVETAMSCFGGWGAGDTKYEIGVIVMMVVLSMVVGMRSQFYYPFHQSDHCMAMEEGSDILYVYAYTLLLSFLSGSEQMVFLLTCFLVFLVGKWKWMHPALSITSNVLGYLALWTTTVIFLLSNLNVLRANHDGPSLFWLIWVLSAPMVAICSYLNHKRIQGWQQLFGSNVNQLSLKHLYLMCSQLVAELEEVGKSELKTSNERFKVLQKLISQHNEKCMEVDCPLAPLSGLGIQRRDDFVEQKRLSKTVKGCLQFGRFILERQRSIFPNAMRLNIQIANYELEVLHERHKGLLLVNTEQKGDLSLSEQFALLFLRKKIQWFYASHENLAKAAAEGELSQFRHNIEVSVTMLAEFWYFLSDPKCNLKKLYDLTNVLFPLKIGVDKSWQSVKQFKNIECYNVYARYLIKMFNDKEKGLSILEEARRIEQESREKEEIELGMEGALQIEQETGIIFLEFDGRANGVMFQVNSSCQKMFGYNRGELLNRKVNDIMPRLISSEHDRILERYQQTNKGNMMNKERSLWGRSKDGYLFPLVILIKPIRNFFSQTSEVYASVKRELWMRETAFTILDNENQITDLSASLLGLYPQLYGKGKRKMHIQEILPNYLEIKEVLMGQETYEVRVRRNTTDDTVEESAFSLALEDIHITSIGKIGSLLKFTKSVTVKPLESIFKSEVERKKEGSKFRLMVSMMEEDGKWLMKYNGGVMSGLDKQQLAVSAYSRAHSEMIKTMNAHGEGAVEKKRAYNYAEGIKLKRLVKDAIKEIHQLSQESEMNEIANEDESRDMESTQRLKYRQLNAILEKQVCNKWIDILKVITIFILFGSCGLIITQYVMTLRHNAVFLGRLTALESINELQSELFIISSLIGRYVVELGTVEGANSLFNEINIVDTLVDTFSFGNMVSITYSNRQKQNILLGFALGNLVSQGSAVAAEINNISRLSANDSHVFYVGYNSVNGIAVESEGAAVEMGADLLSRVDSLLQLHGVFLIVGLSVFTGLLIAKNAILHLVLHQKAQILNVFFQIPRVSCNRIQKECEKFIQRLTIEDEKDFDLSSQASEEDRQEMRMGGKKKKRTIMGEEKTAYVFGIATGGFLLLLLSYHLFVLVLFQVRSPSLKYATEAFSSMCGMEKNTLKSVVYMNAHGLDPTYPLDLRDDGWEVISEQQSNLTSLMSLFAEDTYNLGFIFDAEYIREYNAMFYECTNCSANGAMQANGVMQAYGEYILEKYLSKKGNLQTEELLWRNMKKVWRGLMGIVINGVGRLVQASDVPLLVVMMAMCVLNATVLLYAWWRFYNNLEQKILATEYILTFIPINQINKNPKIVKYIKENILDQK